MERKRATLSSGLTGKDIVRGLALLAKELQLQLSYLPVTIAYANVDSSETKTFSELRVCGPLLKLRVLPPGDLDSFDSETVFDEIVLEAEEATGDAISLFVQAIEARLPELARAVEHRSESVTREGREEYRAPPAGDFARIFRVLVVVQGEYGQRIFDNLRRRGPPHWEIVRMDLTTELPTVIDDPSDYLPAEVPESDLVLFLSEGPNAPQLATDIVRKSRAKGFIAPIDHSDWMPFGQAGQISRALDEWGVEHAFPRPFCSLTESGTPAIDEFARWFGRPVVEIETEDNRTVSRVRVLRGVPCGNTEFVAENIKGVRLDEAVEKAALTHHHYPCLGSMVVEPDLNDTLMHASGFITKSVFEEQVKRFVKKKVGYLDPSQFR
ncbi:MAG: hypothetical protein FJ151_01365 [Euryarchaeota archaeon]|nr:hypothetical protein [Euryarchaeota archaeon]